MEIYLDNAATTRPLREAVAAADRAMEELWYNPSSLYGSAGAVQNEINEIRRELIRLTSGKSLLFTSGGTEGNNTVIRSFVRPGKKLHFVCSQIEHSSVYETMKKLSEEGNDVDFISPREDFRVDPEDVAAAVRPDTALVSVMQVNSETGAINDVSRMARLVAQKNSRTRFHSDGVQAFLKVPLPTVAPDFYTISAHKIGGLKGTGALISYGTTQPKPLISGGSQENAQRGGTENTAGIFAFGAAAAVYSSRASEYQQRMRSLREMAERELSSIDGVLINSAPEEHSAPHILNLSFMGVRGETLLHAAEEKSVLLGVASACSSKKNHSRVLAAQGFFGERLSGVLRLSFSPFNTAADVERAVTVLYEAYNKLKIYKRS